MLRRPIKRERTLVAFNGLRQLTADGTGDLVNPILCSEPFIGALLPLRGGRLRRFRGRLGVWVRTGSASSYSAPE
jgi:hypothetical protein